MDRDVNIHFPVSGIDQTRAYWNQKPRPLPKSQWGTTGQVVVVPGAGPEEQPADVWGRTCAVGINVRGYEASLDRRRGGSRPCLKKWMPTAAVADFIVQELTTVIGSGYPPPGGHMQTSQSGRVVTVVTVQQGNVFVANVGDTTWTPAINATGDTPPLNYTGVVNSAVVNQKVYFFDGTNQALYDPATNAVQRWAATKGSLPADSANNTLRIGCNWRNRLVGAGLVKEPQSWFMLRKDDPTDADYGPLNPDATQPVAGTFQAPQGLISQQINSFCPFSNDVLIAFCSNSIYMFAGDPADGGDIQLVSRTIGGTWNQCWAMGPDGTIFFFSNHTGVYAFVPGQAPQRISQPIDPLLKGINTGANSIRLEYEDQFQCLHIFISPLAGAGAATHVVYELRTGAWFLEQFANPNHNPIATCALDGNLQGNRVILLGSYDGYVRMYDPAALTDDGSPINSQVVIGPITLPTFEAVMLKDLITDLGADSGPVQYDILLGETAEIALRSASAQTGTWGPGRNYATPVGLADHAVYIKLSATNPWALERIRAVVSGQGRTRARGK